jgi:hypothetical protein
MKLHFDAALVQRLFDHSKAAARRLPTMDQLFDARYRRDRTHLVATDQGPPAWPVADDIDPALIPPGLWLVGDDGVYLMSNGDPAALASGEDEEIVFAYAAEADQCRSFGTHRDAKNEAFGGDDGLLLLDAAFVDRLLRLAIGGVLCIDVTAQIATPALPDPEAFADNGCVSPPVYFSARLSA